MNARTNPALLHSAATVAAPAAPPPAIAARAMLISVTVQMWSGRKLDRDATQAATDAFSAQADAGRFNKALVGKAALAKLTAVANKARTMTYARTLPWSDNGLRILSSAGYEAFAAEFRKLEAEFDIAKGEFAADYGQHVERARRDLGAMFKESDYPPAAEIARRFAMYRRLLPMPTAADFRVDLGEGEVARVRSEIEAQVAEAMAIAQRDAFERVSEAVGRMVERLGAYKPGKPGERAEGTFKDSLVENVRELAGLLPSLNVTGDALLAKVTERLGALTRYDAEALRDDAGARKEVRDAAESIMEEVSAYLA